MKVFVSWSGAFGKGTAVIIRKYLPCLLQNLDVFLSEHDLESGSRWTTQLSVELSTSNFGILCLTEEAQHSPWLLFEAGALTKHLEGKACGLLLQDLRPANVAGPLAQFQHRSWSKEDFFKLIRDLNIALEAPLEIEQLLLIFKKFWPDIDAEYQALLQDSKIPGRSKVDRTDREILEEVLNLTRNLQPSGVTLASPRHDHGEGSFDEDSGITRHTSALGSWRHH
jgi:hypothetical protein